MSNIALPLSPLEVRDRCLCFATQRAARTLARRFDRAFLPLGITNNQFSLMNAISGPEPPLMAQLSAFLAMDRTTLTAALKALEKRGLVGVTADSSDRRIRRMRLTAAGRTVLAMAMPIWKAEHDALDTEWPEDHPAQLRRLLAKVAPLPIPRGGNLEQPCAE